MPISSRHIDWWINCGYSEVNKYAQIISDNKTAMTDSQKIMDDNQVLADIAAMEDVR